MEREAREAREAREWNLGAREIEGEIESAKRGS